MGFVRVLLFLFGVAIVANLFWHLTANWRNKT